MTCNAHAAGKLRSMLPVLRLCLVSLPVLTRVSGRDLAPSAVNCYAKLSFQHQRASAVMNLAWKMAGSHFLFGSISSESRKDGHAAAERSWSAVVVALSGASAAFPVLCHRDARHCYSPRAASRALADILYTQCPSQ